MKMLLVEYSDLEKTPREKWYYYSARKKDKSQSSTNRPILSPYILADSANEIDVDTIQFRKCVDEIENEGRITAQQTAQEFIAIRNVSIMIDNKNIVETWITDLKTDIEKDVNDLNTELEAKYKEVVHYHNEKQIGYNTTASEEASKNSTSGETWRDEDQE